MTTTAVVAPAKADVFKDLVQFLQGLFPGVPVIRGIVNRTPMPTGPFIVLTPIGQRRLATNVDSFDRTNPAPTQLMAQQSVQMDLQIDCYGDGSGDRASILSTLWRDEYTCSALTTCQPLYADEPAMMPLIDAEQQYEERWRLDAAIQYNPVTSFQQDFADTLVGELINIDQAYPPS